VVFAASSLAGTLDEVADRWSARGNPPVSVHFDASSRLARQIEAGAAADAFFPADLEWMAYLETRGRIAVGTRVELLENTLVIVVPAGSTRTVAAPADLAALERIGMAAESVPAGRYGRAALGALGVWTDLAPRIVEGDSVRTVLAWTAGREVEAGIVYGTDARAEPRVRTAYTFPVSSHPPIVYPAAVIEGARGAAAAAAFLGWCAGPEAGAVFAAAGFTHR
jgi:molybdate transport system substrate-binding protein